jgi:glutathione S-transferase
MITVHHLEDSRSTRILWLLEELGQPYELETYSRDPATSLAPDSYKALHPLGKSPIVTIDGNAFAETGAIVETILDRANDHDLRLEPGEQGRDAYLYWLHAAEGSLMPLLVMHLFMTVMETRPPALIRPIIKKVTGMLRQSYLTPSLTSQLDYVNSHLSENEWFAGDQLTAADIMMSYPLEAAAGRDVLDRRHTAVLAYLDRLRERPAYKAAIEKGGELNTVVGKS